MAKKKKPVLDLSFLKEPAPNETVLVKKLSSDLIGQFKSWYVVQLAVRDMLFKIVDSVYGRVIEKDEQPEKAQKVMRMIQIAYMHEKPFPKQMVADITLYLSTERRARILEMSFWERVNNDYNLWLKPRIAVRKDFAIAQLPNEAFELRESGQT